MGIRLVRRIEVAFREDEWFFADKRIINGRVAPITRDKKEVLTEMRKEFNKDNELFFKNIFIWSNDYLAFNYFLPEIMIYCEQHNYINNMSLICLMRYLLPDFHEYSYHSYFKELYFFTEEQRKVLDLFLDSCLENEQFPYKESCFFAKKSISWLSKANKLIEQISKEFNTDSVLTSPEDIADENDPDGQYLIKGLLNIHWKTLIKNPELIPDFEYILLREKAFWYFMPACIIISLNDVLESKYIDFSQSIISYLCCIIDSESSIKFSYLFTHFSQFQREIIIQFLKLMSEPDFSDDEEKQMINSSLNYYWYPSLAT